MTYRTPKSERIAPAKGSDAEFLALAQKRFTRCVDHEEECRRLEIEDRRFHAADPDNGWQWDKQIHNARVADPNGARPCLTINKLPQHTSQVTNEQRQNRPSLKAIPVDDKADPKTAEILTGIFRHIQVNSDADVAYDTACDQQTVSGLGFFRVLTDYVSDDSNEQDIFIRRVRNRFSIYIDPDIQDPTGADARFAFVTEQIDEDEFTERYPEVEQVDWKFDERDYAGWYNAATKKVRIAEYWYVEKAKRGRPKVHWCLLSGKEKLETRDWPGKYIPIIRVAGNELEIEGTEVVVKGMIRNAKDAQRMYNYNASMEVEQNALAPKAPFIGYGGQFEGYEDRWKKANAVNYPYLEVNPVVDEATRQVLPLPQRQPPPFTAQAFIQAKLGAADDIKATMGQYDASLGQRSNETSGRAIMARQREGDTGTYHYIDNLAKAIKQAGRVILDLIPYIYDTKRVARIIGEDGTPAMAMVDPTLPRSYQEGEKPFQTIFNPAIGRYDVIVSVGPGFTTKRQEAAESMTATAQAWPKLMDIAGDVVVKSQDWPGADEVAKRIRATIPQEIRGPDDEEQEPIPPAVMQAMEQMKQMIGETQGRLQAAQEALQQSEQEKSKVSAARTSDDLSAQDALLTERAARLKAEIENSELKSKEAIAAAEDAARERIAQEQARAQAQLLAQSANAGEGDQPAPAAAAIQGIGEALLTIADRLANLEQGLAALAAPKRREIVVQGPSGEYRGLVDGDSMQVAAPSGALYSGRLQ